MIKVVYGPKGMGKTRILVNEANKLAEHGKGSVVFIDDNKQLIFDLKRKIRFVDLSEYPPLESAGFFGFICGILSQDYDVEGIFIDRLNFLTKVNVVELESFFKNLETLNEKHNISFFITMNGLPKELPEFLKQYI